ncbi:MAG: hypothetical protein M1818_001593 [Claussenomyces sp. TS43310]|nr:MAG: hypothetical protein M1818_001593 [Claussenomyces sp. TS43310]
MYMTFEQNDKISAADLITCIEAYKSTGESRRRRIFADTFVQLSIIEGAVNEGLVCRQRILKYDLNFPFDYLGGRTILPRALLSRAQGPRVSSERVREAASKLSDTMADKAPQATAIGTDDDPTRGMPYHNKIKADLDEMLQKKRQLDRAVDLGTWIPAYATRHEKAQLDEAVYKKEAEYWENTPFGNILTGFDNYIKGSTGTTSGGRRKGGLTDADRVFSRSSVRLNEAVDSPGLLSSHSTPSHAPTPINTTSLKGDASNAATPTSSTSANKTGAGLKKIKRAAEDSETDTKESKKMRTNFGASRK